MGMEMPYCLVSGRFVMLPRGSTLTTFVGDTDCNGYLFNYRIYFTQDVVGNVVDVFVVSIGNYQYIAGVIDPPFWGNRCGYEFVLKHNVFGTVVFIFFTGKEITKGAGIVGRLMIKDGFNLLMFYRV